MKNGAQGSALITLVIMVAFQAGTGRIASADTGLSIGPGSHVSLDGDSTLHKFKVNATQITASFGALPAGELEDAIRKGTVKEVVLTIPVKGLTSGDSGLDKNLWKAMKADEVPNVTFHLDGYDVLPSTAKDGVLDVRMHGRLSIAGTEKHIDIDAQIVRGSGGLRLVGSKELVMSEYGVKPPVLMAGIIRVKDAIVVRFDVALRLAP